VSSLICDSWPDIYYSLTVTAFFLWGALSDERTGLSFVYVPGPRQRSVSRVRVPWDSWTSFTVSDLRLSFSSRVNLRWFHVKPSGLLKSTVVWDIVPCSPLKFNRSRWYLALLVLPWRWRRYVPPKGRLASSGLHDGISQDIVIIITISVRTWNPTVLLKFVNVLKDVSTSLARLPNSLVLMNGHLQIQSCLTTATQFYCLNIKRRCDVPTVVNMKITVFWDVTSLSMIDRYQRFEGIYCSHLQNKIVSRLWI
jgi:hypothetical protein